MTFMTAHELIQLIRDAGGTDGRSIQDALCDGDALKSMGVTDEHQGVVEEAHRMVREAMGACALDLHLAISASTTDLELEVIACSDMRREAHERRDDAAAVRQEQGNQEVLEYAEYVDGVAVLYSPTFGYAYVNRRIADGRASLIIENGGAESVEHAAQIWRVANVVEHAELPRPSCR